MPTTQRCAMLASGALMLMVSGPAWAQEFEIRSWTVLRANHAATGEPFALRAAVQRPQPLAMSSSGALVVRASVSRDMIWIEPVMAVTICWADCDSSTGADVLDIFDFLCFGNKFAAGDPYACDCDVTTGPGVCDVFDFLCFGNEFDAGCP